MTFLPGTINNFDKFAHKYGDFAVPKYSVSIGGNELDIEKFPILDLNIKMSAGFDMSSCEFTVAAHFSQKEGCFVPDIYEELKPGKPVDVLVGYIDPVGLFKGYINSLSFSFSGAGALVSVQCLDARGALVNSYEWIKHLDLKASQVIKMVLDERCKPYASVGEVNFLFDSAIKQNLYGKELDDYRFITSLASDTYHSFCVVYDTVTFTDTMLQGAKRNVSLKWGTSLIDFSTDIDLSRQFGTAHVSGTNPKDQKPYSPTWSRVPGSGETGRDMSDMVRSKEKMITTTLALDDHQAQLLAKRSMEATAAQMIHCRGSTIGIPDIVCGDLISISGMGHGIDGDFFLTHVTHRINGQGYLTSFEGTSSHVKNTIGMHRISLT